MQPGQGTLHIRKKKLVKQLESSNVFAPQAAASNLLEFSTPFPTSTLLNTSKQVLDPQNLSKKEKLKRSILLINAYVVTREDTQEYIGQMQYPLVDTINLVLDQGQNCSGQDVLSHHGRESSSRRFTIKR